MKLVVDQNHSVYHFTLHLIIEFKFNVVVRGGATKDAMFVVNSLASSELQRFPDLSHICNLYLFWRYFSARNDITAVGRFRGFNCWYE